MADEEALTFVMGDYINAQVVTCCNATIDNQAMTTLTTTPSSRTTASWDIIAPGISHSLLCQMRSDSRHCYDAAATRRHSCVPTTPLHSLLFPRSI